MFALHSPLNLSDGATKGVDAGPKSQMNLIGLRGINRRRLVAIQDEHGDQTKAVYSLIPADSIRGAQTSIEFATKAV